MNHCVVSLYDICIDLISIQTSYTDATQHCSEHHSVICIVLMKLLTYRLRKSDNLKVHSKHMHIQYVPAQFLYEALSTSADLLGKLNDVNPLQDYIVGPHGIRTSKWRTET